MKVDGSCHCGSVTYEAEINPDHVVICHCTDCQTFSSAPYRVSVFGVPRENVRIEGSPKTYIKTGESGRQVLVAFCGDCGTALYSTRSDTAPLNLRIGAIKQRRELVAPNPNQKFSTHTGCYPESTLSIMLLTIFVKSLDNPSKCVS